MARPVTGSNAPDYDSWDEANDSAATAKPQLVDPNKLTVGEDVQVPPSPGQLEDAEREPVSTAQSGLPPAPLTDPLDKSALLALLGAKPQLPLDEGAIKDIFAKAGGSVMYADGVHGTGSGIATKLASPIVAKDVTDLIDRGTKINSSSKDKDRQMAEKETRGEFSTAQKAIAAGDYKKAHESLETLMRKQGEDILSDEDVKSTQTVRDQLEFLSKMQSANIKADYPPTEAQLEDYFKTLKDKPAEARKAFEEYTDNFQVHPVNIKGADLEVKYSHEPHTIKRGNTDTDITTDVPKQWSDVANRPVSSKDFPRSIGKQMNDCKGFGMISEKLLGAAGFKVEKYVDAVGAHGEDHEMVMFTHAGEKGVTLTSNDKTFHGTDQRAVAKDGLKHGTGKEVPPDVLFVVGKTAEEAEIQMVMKEHKL